MHPVFLWHPVLTALAAGLLASLNTCWYNMLSLPPERNMWGSCLHKIPGNKTKCKQWSYICVALTSPNLPIAGCQVYIINRFWIEWNWIEHWTELNWIELVFEMNWIVLDWIELMRTELVFWIENWTGIWIELNWIELNWELNWYLNWIDLTWLDLTWLDLTWIELNWIELNWIESNQIKIEL